MTKKILIIDDDKIFSKVLRDSLCTKDSEDCVVINTYDGAEGLIVARKEKPDLIISDLMMPKMDGIEFIKKLKLENELSDIPVLISTQVPDMDKISEAIELGVKGYIIKAEYTLEGIVKQVNDILNIE
jgi:DNA-binding NarL/FixJ family response regulator